MRMATAQLLPPLVIAVVAENPAEGGGSVMDLLAVPPGQGRLLLPAVRAMDYTRTSCKRALFSRLCLWCHVFLVSWTRATGPLWRADCLHKETTMDQQLTGHLTWSTDPSGPGWQLT